MHRTDEKCIQDVGQKPERKRPLRRARHTWEDVDWIHLNELYFWTLSIVWCLKKIEE
jgi:hypothetical protein